MTGIDQISQTLGRLEADMVSSQNQRATLFELLGKVEAALGELKTELAVLKTTDAQQGEAIERLQSDVSALKVTKIKAGAALTVIAGLGAGAYEGIGKLIAIISKIYGGH